jgi:hypothetical protein
MFTEFFKACLQQISLAYILSHANSNGPLNTVVIQIYTDHIFRMAAMLSTAFYKLRSQKLHTFRRSITRQISRPLHYVRATAMLILFTMTNYNYTYAMAFNSVIFIQNSMTIRQ